MYLKFKLILSSFILAFVCSLNTGIYAAEPAAKSTLDTIVDTVSSLTCQTQGVGDLLRSEFSHTCIPAPFVTFAVYNLISPLVYLNTMLCLKINDDEIFPGGDHEIRDVPFKGGSCTRQNRIDPKDEVISFAFCNNIKLLVYNTTAVAKATVAIVKSVITGDSPWDSIKDILVKDRKLYHDIFPNKKEGESGVTLDVPPALWKVVKLNDRLCVATISFTGYVPVGCKYIKEPYPKSIYSSFMDLDDAPTTTFTNDQMLLTKCANPGGCYQRAFNNSKTGIVITSPLIECVREMIVRLLVSRDVCSFEDISLIVNSAKKESSSFFVFQRNMQKAVTAFLTIYVIIFGFKILLTGDVPPKSEVVTFVLKIIFVTYFSVGINIDPYSGSDYGKLDGMVQWAFPFLLGGINQLASWIMAASPSSLCKFGTELYSPDLAHLALWDALDCRVSHYLGLDVLATVLVENQARSHDFANFDAFNFSAPPYFYLLIPAVISGNMTLISLTLMYPLLVISVGAYLVNSTVVCMISIVILGILSPLFVPMMLFQYTRGYFESWVKLMLSFLLQPMVVVVFMLTMFSVYDFGFYGNCKYTSKEVNSGIGSLSAGSILGPDNNRKVKIFYIDNDWKSYTPEEVKSCKGSLGYMLNNPIQAMYDYKKDVVKQMKRLPGDKDQDGNIIPKPGEKDKDGKTLPKAGSTEEYTDKFDFLDAVSFSPAMFFVSPKVLFEKLRDIALALITACFSLYLMYHFSAQLSEFAADMTQGVDLSKVTINPQSVFKAGMAALGAANKLKGGLDKISAGGKGGGAGDKASAGGGGDGEDKVSTGGEDGEDSVSTDTGSGEDHVSTSSRSSGPTRTRSNAIVPKDNRATTQSNDDALEGVGPMFTRAEREASKGSDRISDEALGSTSAMFERAQIQAERQDKKAKAGISDEALEGASAMFERAEHEAANQTRERSGLNTDVESREKVEKTDSLDANKKDQDKPSDPDA